MNIKTIELQKVQRTFFFFHRGLLKILSQNTALILVVINGNKGWGHYGYTRIILNMMVELVRLKSTKNFLNFLFTLYGYVCKL